MSQIVFDISEFINEPPAPKPIEIPRKAYYAARREHAWLLQVEGLSNKEIAERLGTKGSITDLVRTFSIEVQQAIRYTTWRII